MIARSRARLAFVVSSAAAIAACVDLFHATDFPTLCDQDAAACADGAPPAETGAPDVVEASAPIDLCATSGTEARKRAERVCAHLGGCLGALEDTRFGECMVRALAAYDCSHNPSLRPRGTTAVLWNCLSTASTCDAVELCVFGTPAPPCGQANGTYTACNRVRDDDGGIDAGPVLVECNNSTVAVGMNPCQLRGRTCAKVDETNTKSICAGARGAACTGNPRCEGTSAVSCRSAGGIDADEGTDCALSGDGRCVLDDAGVACAPSPTAPSCTSTSQVVCNDAGAAESCVGGSTVQIDCAAIDHGCSADGVLPVDPFLACRNLDAGTACSETEDACDAGTLVSCARGMRFELSCASVGLGACTKVGGRRAVCTEL